MATVTPIPTVIFAGRVGALGRWARGGKWAAAGERVANRGTTLSSNCTLSRLPLTGERPCKMRRGACPELLFIISEEFVSCMLSLLTNWHNVVTCTTSETRIFSVRDLVVENFLTTVCAYYV